MNDYAPQGLHTYPIRPAGHVGGTDDASEPSGTATVWATADAGLGGLVGASPAMHAIFEQITKVAPTRAGVLILGESGTGKELVARTLHQLSPRADRPFVAVNCGAIPESLIEAELFGYERGSFTGAVRSHAGYFERAADGTLLLDEITEMSLEMQAKLLRALESGQLLRVGGTREVEVRCRVIAATNRDPQAAVASGQLRADLLYRLAVFPIRVAPLRERTGDALLLAEHFLGVHNAAERTAKTLSPDSLAFLREYEWPGNVRELRNVIQRAYILSDQQLHLRSAITRTAVAPQSHTERADHVQVTVGMPLAEVERLMIVATLKRCGGNKTRTAAMLGVSLKTLYNRLNEYRAAAVAAGTTGARNLVGYNPTRPMVRM